MFRNIFKIRPKRFLGIDVGTSSIRVIEIGRRAQAYKLKNYGEVGISSFDHQPFRVVKKNTLSLSNKNIAEAVQTVCQEAGIQTKEVNFSIPDFCSFFTSFKLPSMGKDEIPEAVKYEVRPYIPLPLDEITLDWSIAEGEPSKTPLTILVVAIPNEVISQYQEIASLADLKLRILEPEVFALARSLSKNEKKKKEKEVIGLIDIGARSTTCSILEQGVLKTSYSFNIAGNELTEVIARSLNIDYNKAEELKREQGLVNREVTAGSEITGLTSGNQELGRLGNLQQGISSGKKNTREVLLPLIDSILGEIKKVFRDFYRHEGTEIKKIVLAGSLVSMPGLKEYFSSQLKKEVSFANPFLHIDCPPILSETLKEMGSSYAIAVGLALKGLE